MYNDIFPLIKLSCRHIWVLFSLLHIFKIVGLSIPKYLIVHCICLQSRPKNVKRWQFLNHYCCCFTFCFGHDCISNVCIMIVIFLAQTLTYKHKDKTRSKFCIPQHRSSSQRQKYHPLAQLQRKAWHELSIPRSPQLLVRTSTSLWTN